MALQHENTMVTRVAEFRAIGLDAAKFTGTPPAAQPYNLRPRQIPQQPPLPQLPADSAPSPRTCYTCGLPGHVKKDCPQPAAPASGNPSASSSGGSSSSKNPANKSKDGGIQGSSPYASRNTIFASEKTNGAVCGYCQQCGHTIDQYRKKKYADARASQNIAQPVDDESWNLGNLLIDLYASCVSSR